VRDISIFYTRIITLDNKLILVPTGDLMSSNVTNFTAEPKRRIDQDFKITNDIDQDLVRKVLYNVAKNTEGVLDDPEPFARLTAVDDDTYIFTVRAWCETSRYWDVYFDLIENCSTSLSDNGIDDPEERIAVRIVKDEDEAESTEN
ncbi:MAG: mechanosensitive ion channel, partial [Clostridia bacterium]|nr:mechanosensitive ion channel [Clostridia bacterium]